MHFNLSFASEKGKRPYQEDAKAIHWIPGEGHLLAVFDGHGGSEVANYCADRLVSIWTEVRNNIRNNILVANFESILRNVFFRLNEETNHMGPGSTASIVFIPESLKEVIVGVLGDSPVLVRKADGVIWRSPEHNVRSNITEATAARQRGGYISHGYLYASFSSSGLQMSRAFGDANLSKVLLRTPEIFRLPLDSESFVLVASDGVFDPEHDTDQSQIIADKINDGATAKDLVDAALAVPTHDNATAILLQLSDEKELTPTTKVGGGYVTIEAGRPWLILNQ